MVTYAKRKLTPPEVAKIYRVNPDKVISWIRSGELRAINTSNGSIRPRYLIDSADLEAFEQAREFIPQVAPRRPYRRKRSNQQVVEFFEP